MKAKQTVEVQGPDVVVRQWINDKIVYERVYYDCSNLIASGEIKVYQV